MGTTLTGPKPPGIPAQPAPPGFQPPPYGQGAPFNPPPGAPPSGYAAPPPYGYPPPPTAHGTAPPVGYGYGPPPGTAPATFGTPPPGQTPALTPQEIQQLGHGPTMAQPAAPPGGWPAPPAQPASGFTPPPGYPAGPAPQPTLAAPAPQALAGFGAAPPAPSALQSSIPAELAPGAPIGTQPPGPSAWNAAYTNAPVTQPTPNNPPAGAPAPGSAGATFPGVTTTPPQNAWWPAAVVSLVFPGLGLLFLRGRFRLAFAIFAASMANHVVLRPLIAWAQPTITRQVSYGGVVTEIPVGGSPAIVTLLTIVWLFVMLVLMVGSAVFTHDETVRERPELGPTLIFKKPLALPPQLRG